MKVFQFCLLATLLAFGSACSKKLNTQSREFIEKEKAEKALKAKLAEEQKTLALQDSALKISTLLTEDESLDDQANLEIYQLLLIAQNNDAESVKDIVVKDGSIADHSYDDELVAVKEKTGKSNEQICAGLTKKIAKNADTDLINLNSKNIQNDVERLAGCRGLIIKANFVTVKDLKNLCSISTKRNNIEIKPVDVSEIRPIEVQSSEISLVAPKIAPVIQDNKVTLPASQADDQTWY